ncbi:NAD(P)H-binding protein [Actinoplanes sp. NPDC049596]|uniref:NAD(P)-dependent oxidoreductase n=1 Tax=unclassified Actinoplanes TaxID=2626549 RepID=UPI00344A2724
MRFTVFGATGPIGRSFLRTTADRGIDTVAFVRDPARLAGAPAGRIVTGDVFDQAGVRAAVTGSDAVLVAFGLKRDRRTPLYSDGTQTIVEAMESAGVRRLLVMSEASYGRHVTGVLNRLIVGAYGLLNAPALAERRRQDDVVARSGLDWTIVRGRVISDLPSRGPIPVRLNPHGRVTDRTAGTDLARFMVDITADVTTFSHNVYP